MGLYYWNVERRIAQICGRFDHVSEKGKGCIHGESNFVNKWMQAHWTTPIVSHSISLFTEFFTEFINQSVDSSFFFPPPSLNYSWTIHEYLSRKKCDRAGFRIIVWNIISFVIHDRLKRSVKRGCINSNLYMDKPKYRGRGFRCAENVRCARVKAEAKGNDRQRGEPTY